MNNIVISILGARLDHQGLGKRRWTRWRPNLAILMQDDFRVDEFVLIYHSDEQQLLDLTVRDMAKIAPDTRITTHRVDYQNPWDFEQVYGQLYDFTGQFTFDPEHNDYYTHITTGTHVHQICLFLLTEARYLPGRLIQTGPPKGSTTDPCPTRSIIDLDRYLHLAEAGYDVWYRAEMFVAQICPPVEEPCKYTWG